MLWVLVKGLWLIVYDNALSSSGAAVLKWLHLEKILAIERQISFFKFEAYSSKLHVSNLYDRDSILFRKKKSPASSGSLSSLIAD